MNIAIIIFYSILGIWQTINFFRFFQSMTRENADDVENAKLSLLWPMAIFILCYFGSLFIVGFIENPKSVGILIIFKRLIMIVQAILIIAYPFVMSGELATRALSVEITGAPSAKKRMITLHSNLTGQMVLTFAVSSIIYIIL